MSKSLTKLLRASGKAGIINQRFGDVTPSPPTAGTSMTSYMVTGWSFDNVGIPPLPGELLYPEASGTTYNVVANMTRGANAYRIQQLGAPWFSASVTYTGDAQGAGAFIDSVTTADGGSTFNIAVRAVGKQMTPAPVVNYAMSGAQPIDWGVAWNGEWTVAVGGTPGPSDHDDFAMTLGYTPDSAGFSPPLTLVPAWSYRMSRVPVTIDDVEVVAWDNLTGATNQTNEGKLPGEGPWSITSYGNGHPSNVNTTIYWRWRFNNGLVWSAVLGPNGVSDTRLGA